MALLKKPRVYFNGKVVPEDRACVSVLDRGFNYGDGLFETLKASRGRPVLLAEHTARLRAGARALGFALKSLDPLFADIRAGVIEKLLARNGLLKTDAHVRITVTRGVGGSGHTPPKNANPTTVIVARGIDPDAIEVLRKRGVRAVTLTGPLPTMAGIKSLNFLPNIMGKTQALKQGAFEGIFIGEDSMVREGTSTNVFMVAGDEVVTPPAGTLGSSDALPGVTRGAVMELAVVEGFRVIERPFTAGELAGGDEAFLTNSILEVLPLVKIDSRKVGSGATGPVTRLLQRLLAQKVRGVTIKGP